MAGTLDPDVTGTYEQTDDWGAYPAWINTDGPGAVWYDTLTSLWTLSSTLGAAALSWTTEDPTPNSTYTPATEDATGEATVTGMDLPD